MPGLINRLNALISALRFGRKIKSHSTAMSKDLRRRRVSILHHEIMSIVFKEVQDRAKLSRISVELMQLFEREGIEIIINSDRRYNGNG